VRITCGVLWHLGALGWAKGMIFSETTENYDYILKTGSKLEQKMVIS
jgi:hypothetical protein